MLLVNDMIAQEDKLPPPKEEHYAEWMLENFPYNSRSSYFRTLNFTPSDIFAIVDGPNQDRSANPDYHIF